MKKILMTWAAVLCCAMTTTVFTACGSDDDDNNKPVDVPATGVYLVKVGDTPARRVVVIR